MRLFSRYPRTIALIIIFGIAYLLGAAAAVVMRALHLSSAVLWVFVLGYVAYVIISTAREERRRPDPNEED